MEITTQEDERWGRTLKLSPQDKRGKGCLKSKSGHAYVCITFRGISALPLVALEHVPAKTTS